MNVEIVVLDCQKFDQRGYHEDLTRLQQGCRVELILTWLKVDVEVQNEPSRCSSLSPATVSFSGFCQEAENLKLLHVHISVRVCASHLFTFVICIRSCKSYIFRKAYDSHYTLTTGPVCLMALVALITMVALVALVGLMALVTLVALVALNQQINAR